MVNTVPKEHIVATAVVNAIREWENASPVLLSKSKFAKKVASKYQREIELAILERLG